MYVYVDQLRLCQELRRELQIFNAGSFSQVSSRCTDILRLNAGPSISPGENNGGKFRDEGLLVTMAATVTVGGRPGLLAVLLDTGRDILCILSVGIAAGGLCLVSYRLFGSSTFAFAGVNGCLR